VSYIPFARGIRDTGTQTSLGGVFHCSATVGNQVRDARSAEGIGEPLRPHEDSSAGARTETLRAGAWAIRGAAWALYPLLAIGYIATLMAAPAGMGRFSVLEAIYLLPIVAGVVLGAVAARQSAGTERRYWVLISLANALLGWCEVMLLWWLAFVSPQGPPPVTWQFQAVHVVAAGCFVTIVLSMTRLQSAALATRVRGVLDFAALGLVVFAAILVLYARPVMAGSHAPVADVLVGSGYVLAACLMLMGTLGNIVGFKLVKWRSWETLTAVAVGIYSIAIAMWPMWYTTVVGNSRNMERGVLDLIQFSGHFLLATAAVYRLTERDAWYLRPLPLPPVARRRWVSALLPGLSVAAILLLGVAALSERARPEWFAVFGTLALALTVLVLARTLTLALEHGQLFLQSVTDPLTGLYNHRYFQDQLTVELDRAARYQEELAVVVFDLDEFGDFNARFGHLAGDRLLAGLGERLASLVVGHAVAARLGGDEFGILLPGCDARSAAIFTQHVLDVIGVECGMQPGDLSASAGVAAYPEHGDDAARLLHLADGSLFNAKETGRGRVIVYDAGHVPDLSAHERIERLERLSRISAVRALAAAVDARDSDTRFHAQRVADLALGLAQHMQLPDERARFVETAAVIHDVGKIAVPDSVLKKPGALEPAEWEEIRSHPEHGQRILAATGLPDLVPAVRSHHERWDGTGYPDGLVGNEIPFEARLLAVCGAYEAMTADRAYRPALTAEQARAELLAGAGTQFDPRLTEELIGMLDAEPCVDPRPAASQLGTSARTQGRRAWQPVGGLGPERT
jgi:diguanylate cyclase (GGDEF)-like protein